MLNNVHTILHHPSRDGKKNVLARLRACLFMNASRGSAKTKTCAGRFSTWLDRSLRIFHSMSFASKSTCTQMWNVGQSGSDPAERMLSSMQGLREILF